MPRDEECRVILKNRARRGLCPCCNRLSPNLDAHIAKCHPEFAPATDHNGVKT